MKLDPKGIRYLSTEDWRVLAAVEQGSRNHEVVPTPLITSLTNARAGSSITKSISTLAKMNLIAKTKNAKYDGYRLTYGGLDYLALHTHLKSGTIYSVGNQIGVGKESDIFVVASPTGRRLVLKIHRLGRISFRTVKANRDYLRNRSSASWMYMSRLAAMKEYAFMRALRDSGFKVPEPVAQNRHTVVMELIDAFPLRQISEIPQPAELYGQLVETAMRLAKFGLIHGDFNEFNVLVEERDQQHALPSDLAGLEGAKPAIESSQHVQGEPKTDGIVDENIPLDPILIDFPQMLSTAHPNAQYYFERDIACLKRFFSRRFGFESDEPGPFFADAMNAQREAAQVGNEDGERRRRLDVEVEASGFSKAMAKELEKYMKDVGVDGDNGEDAAEDEDTPNNLGVDDEDGYNGVEESAPILSPGALTEERLDASLAALDISPREDMLPELPSLSSIKATTSKVPKPPGSVISSASTAGRSRYNPAKAATGWVI